MGGTFYKKEHKQWIIDNFSNYKNYASLTKDFNKEFELDRCKKSIERLCRERLGLKFQGEHVSYSLEEIEYIISLVDKYTWGTIAKMVYEKYGNYHSRDSLASRFKQLGYRTNRCYKEKGIVSKNCKPIGYEYIDPKGRVYVKCTNTGNNHYDYRYKNVLLYEKYHNCKVDSKKYSVIFLDGDHNNYDVENLYLLDNRLFGKLNKRCAYGMGKITKEMIRLFELELKVKGVTNE